MKRKIFIGIGVIIILFVVWVVYGLFFATPASPPDTAEGSYGDLNVKVAYSRPYKKGRLIFGEESNKALVPYGKYWRLGANQATEITFSKDVTFAGEPISAGTYRMYAIPNASTWEVALNSELGVFFGINEPDYELDVLKVKVPVQAASSETEQFTINFEQDSAALNMNFIWDKTKVSVPISPK